MDNPDNFNAPSDSTRAGNNILLGQCEVLRKLFIASLVGLLLLGLSFNYFILRQMVFTRKDLDVVRPQVAQMVEGYTKNEEPQIRSYVNSLITFAKTHPDFTPILAKYKIVPATGTTAPPALAPAAAVPAAPASPAKKK